MVVFGGLRSAISHSNWVGSRLTWPARLIACTSNVHSSSARFSYVFGETQGSHSVPVASPVRRHSKVLPSWSELKWNVALRLSFWTPGSAPWSSGPESTIASGRASTVQVCFAGVGSNASLTLLRARTKSVCSPIVAVYSYGLLQELHSSASTLHSNSASDSFESNWKTTSAAFSIVSSVGFGGPSATSVSGENPGASAIPKGDRLPTTPQTIPFTGSSSVVTSTHSPPSLWTRCGSCGRHAPAVGRWGES